MTLKKNSMEEKQKVSKSKSQVVLKPFIRSIPSDQVEVKIKTEIEVKQNNTSRLRIEKTKKLIEKLNNNRKNSKANLKQFLPNRTLNTSNSSRNFNFINQSNIAYIESVESTQRHIPLQNLKKRFKIVRKNTQQLLMQDEIIAFQHHERNQQSKTSFGFNHESIAQTEQSSENPIQIPTVPNRLNLKTPDLTMPNSLQSTDVKGQTLSQMKHVDAYPKTDANLMSDDSATAMLDLTPRIRIQSHQKSNLKIEKPKKKPNDVSRNSKSALYTGASGSQHQQKRQMTRSPISSDLFPTMYRNCTIPDMQSQERLQ